MNTQQRIYQFVTRTNWLLFIIASMIGFALTPLHFALGIMFGGLIVTVNFHILSKTITKALKPPYLSTHNVVLVKYYIRFAISGFIIFVLIHEQFVHPVGLVIGLSVVVASICAATVNELTKSISKEAV